jgi:gamma-carbonic anhydrase
MATRPPAGIDAGATIAPTALIDGDVTIGAGTCILPGAQIVSHGAPVVIGSDCVIMESAIIRGAGKHACHIGDGVLVGPHAHVSGARIEDGVFIGTGAVVLNGSVLRSGTVIQVHAVVQINTVCAPETVVPIGFVAAGNPAQIRSAAEFAKAGQDLGFTKAVFGFDTTNWPNKRANEELCRKYASYLGRRLKGSR